MVKGSCFCGEIEYEVELVPGKVFNCHCSQCRKSHGAGFATQAFAHGNTLKFNKGEAKLKGYQQGHGIRAFCSHCGSRLMNYTADKSYLSIALATIDSATDAAPVANAFVASKAEWVNICDNLPCFDSIPENAF